MSNRLNKLFNKYDEQLVKHTDKPIELFSNIVSCDITKGKYVEFILKCYLNKTIQENDLIGGLESTVGKTLILFNKNKKFLEPQNRSLNKYKTVGDLWKTVKNYDKEKSSHEIKKEYREKINKETKFIIDKDFKILNPLTKESAQFWGRNTRWCTSAENNNMFDEYNNQAPLYIVVLPNGHKIQFWNHEDTYEAMDEADNYVNKEYIENNWEYFKYIKELIHISLIPKNERTKELCEIAVKNTGYLLKYVPEKLKTKELCEKAIKNDSYAFDYVPEELKTKELCERAVKNDGRLLNFVPDKFKTEKLCKLAIKQNIRSLKFIPEKQKTKELYKFAVKQNGYAIQYVPEKLKTKELYELTVKQNGYAIKYIPKELIDKDIALEAIKQNSNSIKYIPDNINLMDELDIDPKTKEITLKKDNNQQNTHDTGYDVLEI